MIKVTRLNHVPLFLNSDLIEHIDMTPDTVISLTTGQKFMVLEPADEIVERIIDFRRSFTGALPSISNTSREHAAQVGAESLNNGR